MNDVTSDEAYAFLKRASERKGETAMGDLAAELTGFRTQALTTARAEAEALREALKKARKIISDVEDYMARPDRGDWGSECALCMSELFDDDREAIAAIDAALASEPGK